MNFVPRKCFLTGGVGFHQEKLASFEWALRDAKIAEYNLVPVSSIFPNKCEWVDTDLGKADLNPGQVVFCVMSQHYSSSTDQVACASVGVAYPEDRAHHGYIYEYHADNLLEVDVRKRVTLFAAELLATSLGKEPPSDVLPEQASLTVAGKTLLTNSLALCAKAKDEETFACALAAVVFVL